LRGEKHFNFKNPFQCDSIFSPLHHTISKTLSKIIEKVFLTLFGQSFSLFRSGDMHTGETGQLVPAGVALLTYEENFVEIFLDALGFLSLPTPSRDPSVDFGAFSLNTVKMDLTIS
jgi:hypothetical protein